MTTHDTREAFLMGLTREQRERHERQVEETVATERESSPGLDRFFRRLPQEDRAMASRQIFSGEERERTGSEPAGESRPEPQPSAQDIHLGQVKDPLGSQGRFVAEEGGVAREGDTETQTVQAATVQGFESAAEDVTGAVPSVNLDLDLPKGPGLAELGVVGLAFLAGLVILVFSYGAGRGAGQGAVS